MVPTTTFHHFAHTFKLIGDPEFSLAVPDLYFFKILNKIRPLISNMATILKFDFENFEI